MCYRLQQFWRIVTADPLSASAQQEVSTVLSRAEEALFYRLTLSDQWHSIRVLRALRADGHTETALLAAALLHDVGKTRFPLSLWDRTLIVLAQALLPGKIAAWGAADPVGWRRPFVIKMQHPEWGAEMAREAGCAPPVVWLIRHHQDKLKADGGSEWAALLRPLQWADDRN
ncbi:MAG: HD domain-containing protein [Anaerolineae bacterium]